MALKQCKHVNQTKYHFCCKYLCNLFVLIHRLYVLSGYAYNANHPFHFHGYSFRVIGMDRLAENIEVETVKQLDAEGKLYRNLVNPPIKDTITVPDGGYTILRVHATNPGKNF